MAYVTLYSACYICTTPFHYNPNHVPSIAIDGVRQPICGTCMDFINAKRKASNLEPLAVHPHAYDGEDEANIAWPDDD